MRAESQSMLIEEAQGQETVQALFMQTHPKEQAVILNCRFERDPADGKLYYVYSGTREHYMQFRALMDDYGVKPAHEIEGHRANPATQQAAAEAAGETAPVVDTAPAETKSAADTSESPELSATEGDVIVAPTEEPDVASIRSPGDANGGQPSAGDAGPGGPGTGGQPHDGSGHGAGAAAGGGTGREAPSPDASGSVDGQGLTPTGKPDPFKDIM